MAFVAFLFGVSVLLVAVLTATVPVTCSLVLFPLSRAGADGVLDPVIGPKPSHRSVPTSAVTGDFAFVVATEIS